MTIRPPQKLASVKRVHVGTSNPPKLEAVRLALSPYAPHASVEGSPVASGVPEQPVGLSEITTGARNRARAALQLGSCDLAVGIEDGLVSLEGVDAPALNIACVIVTDGSREGLGLSSAFAYPAACIGPALQHRAPIGALFDDFWRSHRGAGADAPASVLSSGNVGKLSLGVLTRSEYARHAVTCALIPFLHPDLYGDLPAWGDAPELVVESLR